MTDRIVPNDLLVRWGPMLDCDGSGDDVRNTEIRTDQVAFHHARMVNAFTPDGGLIVLADHSPARRAPAGRPDYADPVVFPGLRAAGRG